ESATHGLGEILDVAHQEVVLHAGAGDAHGVALLESVLSDGGRRNLTAEDHHRDGIHIGGGNARDGIRHAGTTGDQGHANLVGGTGIGICSVNGRLFV